MWNGHVRRISERCVKWEPEGRRQREQLRKKWIDYVKKNMNMYGLLDINGRASNEYNNLGEFLVNG